MHKSQSRAMPIAQWRTIILTSIERQCRVVQELYGDSTYGNAYQFVLLSLVRIQFGLSLFSYRNGVQLSNVG